MITSVSFQDDLLTIPSVSEDAQSISFATPADDNEYWARAYRTGTPLLQWLFELATSTRAGEDVFSQLPAAIDERIRLVRRIQQTEAFWKEAIGAEDALALSYATKRELARRSSLASDVESFFEFVHQHYERLAPVTSAFVMLERDAMCVLRLPDGEWKEFITRDPSPLASLGAWLDARLCVWRSTKLSAWRFRIAFFTAAALLVMTTTLAVAVSLDRALLLRVFGGIVATAALIWAGARLFSYTRVFAGAVTAFLTAYLSNAVKLVERLDGATQQIAVVVALLLFVIVAILAIRLRSAKVPLGTIASRLAAFLFLQSIITVTASAVLFATLTPRGAALPLDLIAVNALIGLLTGTVATLGEFARVFLETELEVRL